MKKTTRFLVLAFGLAAFAACDNQTRTTDDTTTDTGTGTGTAATGTNGGRTAVANISGASGFEVNGTATFTQVGDNQVRLVVELRNIPSGGTTRAIHLHETGDCSAQDATSAGPHWNPTDNPHGQRNGGEGNFHKGDLPNLEVANDGTARLDMTVEGWTIGDNSQTDIVNKAVIVHADPDDYVSQPSGNAGTRIACGVITAQATQ